MKEMLFDLLNRSDDEVKYNCRVKYKKLSDGSRVPLEIMYCDRFIFNPDGVAPSELTKRRDYIAAYNEAAAEIFEGKLPRSGNYIPDKLSADEIAERSLRRARRALKDLILCNDFDCFVTLTLDSQKIDRADYSAVIKKLNSFLDNRVRRRGLKYVGVPELHKRGGIHFHFLCNSSALQLVNSGTVSCKGKKKPIKIATADRLGIPLENRQAVYNVADWKLGFSTAIFTYGDVAAVANYVAKYLSKDMAGHKVGGRWYYSGGDLSRPVYSYERVSFNDVNNYTYGFDCAGGRFKVMIVDN